MEQHYEKPLDPLVADMVDKLDSDSREDFEERAGIIEFEARQVRRHAECLALLNLVNRRPSLFTGITALQVELDGVTQWLITTDVAFAREQLSDLGGIDKPAVEIAVVDLADVVEKYCGGIAKLAVIG